MRKESGVQSPESGVGNPEEGRQGAEGKVQSLEGGALRRCFTPVGTRFNSPPPEGTEPLAPGVGF
jgi:hypothetical protein